MDIDEDIEIVFDEYLNKRINLEEMKQILDAVLMDYFERRETNYEQVCDSED